MKYNSKVLCLFTNEFPYGSGEAYLETEISYYKNFEKVLIFALQLRKSHMSTLRQMPENITVIPVPFNIPAYLLYAFVALTDKKLWSELALLWKTKRLSFRAIVQLLIYVSRSHYESDYIAKQVKKNNISLKNSVFYSYRFGYQPYVACLLRKKLKLTSEIVARAHRYDLYEDKKASGYIPMRPYLLNSLKKCFPCSEHGTNYLKECWPQYADKIETRYLGTKDCGVASAKRGDVFRIVSCSNVVPIKRLWLIIDALANITDIPIQWTHYGDGVELDTMKEKATLLPKNIEVIWRGNVSNKTVLKDYSMLGYHLFLNTSSSEGLPVSIMEACSFGIPCVATDVGGTKEIVTTGENGTLLNVCVDSTNLAEVISWYAKSSNQEYRELQSKTRLVWERKFDSEINYSQFCKEIQSY